MNNYMVTHLYRAFETEAHARAFIKDGIVRFGFLDGYKKIEGTRQDELEGRSICYIAIPGSDIPGELSGVHINPIYVFSTAGPDVNLTLLREQYGKYVVRINDPKRLKDAITKSKPVRTALQISGECLLEQVRYNKKELAEEDVQADIRLSSLLIYTQKPKIYQDDREYRYVVIADIPKKHAKDEHLFFELGNLGDYLEMS
jgi:hypothetical protein